MNRKPLSSTDVYLKIIHNLGGVSDDYKITFGNNPIIKHDNGKVILNYYLINKTNNELENKVLVFKSKSDWNRAFEYFRTPITDIESCWIRLLEEEQDYMHFAQVDNCRLCNGKDCEIDPLWEWRKGIFVNLAFLNIMEVKIILIK